ncbi:hypothetical protein C1X59_26355 [Pseudomonas sp. FW215-R2]|jgi:hypothetical protein|uniref:hypothetical protein n=1 Tax=unclassified Pseudomonas TaxID=196821 RepID=UPI000C883EE5|nr:MULTISPECIES: hypothetical protein [unclassified Pseudomonas]PMW95483.1 hypothetical protein C1X59_26355 [Pseudomonas sp. FW215-R2]PMX05810.1 hypothetical protein C1X60_26515 [Pseudomonas sp. FW215-L1]PMX19345.1 hypothetical protein C1X57_24975 [Pseudomonas sp. FW215-E1]PNA23905.1 hypothetical protein C1X58_24530 [Pseudomonas sp. FW215-R4]
MPGEWKPTGGRDTLVDVRLNTGIFNGRPIYIHMTSLLGYTAINNASQISCAPNTARRGQAAKQGIYLNPSTQPFSPEEAHTLLFFDEPRYAQSATHCFIFAFRDAVVVEDFPISQYSWVREIIYRGDINFRDIDLLYRGPNQFVSLTKQNHHRG